MRKLILIPILLLLSLSSASALQQLVSLQGKVDYSGVLVKSGDLAVAIYDNATGGNLVYNSSSDFNKSVVNGYFDVMLGSARNLSIDANRIYWLDASVNGTDIDWGSDERLQFQSPVGAGAVFTSDITQTGKIN